MNRIVRPSSPGRHPPLAGVLVSGLLLVMVLASARSVEAQVEAPSGPAQDGPAPARGIAPGGCYRPEGPVPPGEDRPTSSRTDVVIDRELHATEVATAATFRSPDRPVPPGCAKTVRIVKVGARDPSVSCGLELVPNDILLVRHDAGGWTVDTRTLSTVGPPGHLKSKELHRNWGGSRVVRSLPFGRLLARVGEGPWFDAGGGDQIELRAAGPLQVRINDRDGSFADNDGKLTVELVVLRPPGKAPVSPVPPAKGLPAGSN